MNLPNKLTVARVVAIPFFVLFMLGDFIPYHYLFALIIFAAASFTDFLDGKIARSRNLITDFGKFLDPLADKMLVYAMLICLIPIGLIHAVAVIIIIFRDTAVNGLRSIAASEGKVIAANIFGKIKTFSQMTVSCLTLAALAATDLFEIGCWPSVELAINLAWWAIAAYTAVTTIFYFKQNISLIDPKK